MNRREAAERRTNRACSDAHNARQGRPLPEHVRAYREGWLAVIRTQPEKLEMGLACIREKESQCVQPGPADFEHDRAIEEQRALEESKQFEAAYNLYLLDQVREAARVERAYRRRIRRLLLTMHGMTCEQVADNVFDGEGLAQIVAFEGFKGVRKYLYKLLRKPSASSRVTLELLREKVFGKAIIPDWTELSVVQLAKTLSLLLREPVELPDSIPPPIRCTDSILGAMTARFRAAA